VKTIFIEKGRRRMETLKYFLYLSILLGWRVGNAQTDSLWNPIPQIKISGFLDIFYAYDFNNPETSNRQSFLYNHNRHNEFNLNLGYLKIGVTHPKYRANLALQAGTYVNDNYAAEPGLLKNIFEANIGLSLNKKNNIWLDAGIFASHIGFESAISMDNWTLTRSLLAENSPYYLSGAKLTYKPDSQWEFAALACNGWQHIQKISNNSLPSFGTQIKYTPSDKVTLNWSTFLGTDFPDDLRKMRYFNNFYGQFQINKYLGLIAGFDLGSQQQKANEPPFDQWFSPVIIIKYTMTDKWAGAVRAEYYQDKTGIIVPTNTENGFNTSGLSLNLDYSPSNNILCRFEGRWLKSQDQIFQQGDNLTENNFSLVTSIAMKFEK